MSTPQQYEAKWCALVLHTPSQLHASRGKRKPRLCSRYVKVEGKLQDASNLEGFPERPLRYAVVTVGRSRTATHCASNKRILAHAREYHGRSFCWPCCGVCQILDSGEVEREAHCCPGPFTVRR
jgi:hypothetical protein